MSINWIRKGRKLRTEGKTHRWFVAQFLEVPFVYTKQATFWYRRSTQGTVWGLQLIRGKHPHSVSVCTKGSVNSHKLQKNIALCWPFPQWRRLSSRRVGRCRHCTQSYYKSYKSFIIIGSNCFWMDSQRKLSYLVCFSSWSFFNRRKFKEWKASWSVLLQSLWHYWLL